MTAHGFRATASTILNEREFNRDFIEAALAHQPENEIRRVYNRAAYWKELVGMMQSRAGLLDDFRALSHQKNAPPKKKRTLRIASQTAARRRAPEHTAR